MRTMKEKDPEAEYRNSVANACPGRVHCRLIPKVRKGVPARNGYHQGQKITQDQLLYKEVHYGRH